MKFIFSKFPDLAPLKFTKITLPEIQQDLLKHETQSIVLRCVVFGVIDSYKWGVLYVKDGQTDENDMYSNSILLH